MTDAVTDRIIAKYSRDAKDYELHRRDDPKWIGEHAVVADELARLPEHCAVLDCPVGTGRFLDLYARMGLRCTGVDLCREMLEQTKLRSPDANLWHTDCRELHDFWTASFDAIVCIRLFNLLTEADCALTLRNFARVLRPGGVALVSINTLPEPPEDKPRTIQREGAMLEAIEAAGFEVERRVEVETKGRGLYEVWVLRKASPELGA